MNIYFFASLFPFFVSICSSIHSCVHEWIHAYIHSFIHSLNTYSLVRLLACSLTLTLIRSFIDIIDHSVSLESPGFFITLWRRRKNLLKNRDQLCLLYYNSRYFLSCYEKGVIRSWSKKRVYSNFKPVCYIKIEVVETNFNKSVYQMTENH